MKIARIETFLVAPRWLFCRIETDDGVVGWGEPVAEGSAEVVRTCVHQLGELLIGQDPLRIEDHWQTMTRSTFYRGGVILASAVSGLDQALWDIAGKVRGAPVHELLGGPVRDKVRIYGWVGGEDPSEVSDAVSAQVEAGLTAVKMNAGAYLKPIVDQSQIDAVAANAAAARAALGPEGDFGIDFHGRVSRPSAPRLLAALEPYSPMFVEEPLVPEQSAFLGGLVERTSIPIATGERLYSRQEFLPVLQQGVTVVQPDLCHAGGISEGRRIGALAETFGALLAPHCPLGPIALAASLQVDFATPNFLIQEQSLGIHYNVGNDLLDYLVDPAVFAFTDGHVAR
ncbi:galactonate dehydratase, partial [Pseudactinotalea sp.]|uniref:galactonate dehydratase n=1 Tax=Pseudactinotalea sp. TaxID=1926260 RepID=UPI003B3A4F4C